MLTQPFRSLPNEPESPIRMHVAGAVWDGQPRASYAVMRPGHGSTLAHVQDCSPEEVDIAVQAAAAVARDWAGLATRVRAQHVLAFADAVEAAADELALLDARNGGHPIRYTRMGALKGADTLRYFAGIALEQGGRTIPATTDHLHMTVREPFGVVGVITAYNHPTMFASARTAAAMVAGNAVVVKPAEQTPLSALRLAEIAADHLPAGLFNVIPGRSETGRALVTHPRVRRINFTGSTATALRIQADAAASGSLKRLGFQLSGKNPLIVMPDASPAEASQAAVDGMNLYKVMGQSCGSTSIAYVPAAMQAAFEEAVGARLSALRPADPEDAATEVGALVSAAHRDRVEGMVQAATDAGARIVAGGRRPDDADLADGYYYLPTALANLAPDAPIRHTEVFGPVLSVVPWSTEAELLEMVNASAYGLTAAIYSHDLDAALRVAQQVEAGYVWVNDVEVRWVGVPFGGYKDSGTSIEFSGEELLANSQQKTISIRVGQAPSDS
jgi:acyl-CoA reductase-like NAD-dependent aldehyde dehydrogenase